MPPAHPVQDPVPKAADSTIWLFIPVTKVSVRVLQTSLKTHGWVSTTHRHPTSGHEGNLALRVGHPGQVALIPSPFPSLRPLPSTDPLGLMLAFHLSTVSSKGPSMEKSAVEAQDRPKTPFSPLAHVHAVCAVGTLLALPLQHCPVNAAFLDWLTRSPHPPWHPNLPRSAPGHDLQVEGGGGRLRTGPRGLGVGVRAPGAQAPAGQPRL